MNNSGTTYLILILVLFVLLIFSIRRAIKLSKLKKEQNQKLYAESGMPLTSATIKHVYGIDNLTENEFVTLALYDDRLDIKAKNETFKLPLNKLRNFDRKIDTEITQQYVSSIGGAALGGFLAGPLGMAFGGRAKKKKSVDRKFYIVVGYDTTEGKKIILFEDAGLSGNKLIKKVNELVTIEHITTEL